MKKQKPKSFDYERKPLKATAVYYKDKTSIEDVENLAKCENGSYLKISHRQAGLYGTITVIEITRMVGDEYWNLNIEPGQWLVYDTAEWTKLKVMSDAEFKKQYIRTIPNE